ncbi:MAG: HisS family protein, partial [Candidatus Taylorbacteria bacterium]|nr:HisS family protein [Candidatus Taylorbacteria bacterium]
GRVREHWQLNVDIFGIESINAEVEIINIAYDITRAYGLKDTDFEIRINNRKIVNYILREVFPFTLEMAHKLGKLIDKKDKMKQEVFDITVREIFQAEKTIFPDSDVAADKFLTLLNSKNFEEFTSQLPQTKEEHEGLKELRQVIQALEKLGITNVRFDQTLMRGFDYYTGIVFEVYDLNPTNRRSVFGGGRYDDLLSLFGNEKVPGVGFGAGDVIARDLMETYNNLPKPKSAADVALIVVGDENIPYALEKAQDLREKGIRVSVDFSNKKVGDKIGNADKRSIPKIICIGDEEVKTAVFKVKNLATSEEVKVSDEQLYEILLK